MFDDFGWGGRSFPAYVWVCAFAVAGYSQAPPTFKEVLQQHHVEITEVALVRALHSPDKKVRGVAAAELAELKMTSALPEIVFAAKNESDVLTQMNMASALTWLDSDEGLKILTGICTNSTMPAYVRANAARSVFDKEDHSCFAALVEMMRPIAETDARIYAMNTASQIKHKTEQEAGTVLASVLEALQDQDMRLRIEACVALRWLNDAKAIPALRKAIEVEREEIVREQMKSTLGRLEKKQVSR